MSTGEPPTSQPHERPSWETFAAAPLDAVAAVAPPSVLIAVGGSRRAATLAGVAPHSDAYAPYSREHMMALVARLFAHGVQHVITPAIRPGQLAETGRYRERLLHWAAHGIAGPEALADYAQWNWRVRLIGVDDVPELQPAASSLLQATPPSSTKTLWWIVNRTADSPWQHLLAAVARTGARTQADAIRALYGEAIPPLRMLLSFGKPMIVPDIVPPVLIGDMQCYWYQQPGYDVAPATLRRVWYDYAYLRSTWQANRDQRYDAVARQRALWENDIVLGLGRRVDDFWYPTSGT